MESLKRYKKLYMIIQIVMIILAVILYKAINWSSARTINRMGFDVFILGVIILSPFFLINSQKIVDLLVTTWEKTVCFLKKNKKRNTIFIILVIGGSVVLSLIGRDIAQWSGYRFKFWEVVVLLVLSVFFYHDYFSNKIHIFFFCSMMLIGSLFVCEYPSVVGVSWDDQIHYARTLKLVNAFDGINYEADVKIISEVEIAFSQYCYDAESRAAYMHDVEELYSQKAISENDLGTLGIYSVSYIPSAIGILIARGLGLNFRHMFMLGKLFNLLMYVVLVTLAIRKTPYGKVLMTVVGMIPTMIFMAASYSYDPWVLGWSLLGYAYFIFVICGSRKDNNKSLIISAACITIGCLPKAVYFPLLFPLLFVGKDTIQNDKKRKIAKTAVVLCIMVLVGSYLLPMLIHGVGSGDVRGGTDVNSAEQIKFILRNPFKYFMIWFNFIKDYISVVMCKNLVFFAYAGYGQCYGLVMAVLLSVGLLDRMNVSNNRTMIKGITVISLIMILVLVPTALYIDFTAVASPTIAGCSYRYIMPVIFPALLFSFTDKIVNRINKKAFVLLPTIIMIFVLLISLYTNMVVLL